MQTITKCPKWNSFFFKSSKCTQIRPALGCAFGPLLKEPLENTCKGRALDSCKLQSICGLFIEKILLSVLFFQ